MDKRIDHATQEDLHPSIETDQEETDTAVGLIVPVHVARPVRTIEQSAQFGVYSSFYIAPKGVALIVPEDPDRLRAVIQATNTVNTSVAYTVLCNSQSAAQAVGNIASATNTPPVNPAGFLTGNSPLIFESQSAVWAVNCDPTNAVIISVCVERVNP